MSAAGRKTHVTFNFRPKRRTIDHEHAQGSLLALPLLIVIAVIVFNHNKVCCKLYSLKVYYCKRDLGVLSSYRMSLLKSL